MRAGANASAHGRERDRTYSDRPRLYQGGQRCTVSCISQLVFPHCPRLAHSRGNDKPFGIAGLYWKVGRPCSDRERFANLKLASVMVDDRLSNPFLKPTRRESVANAKVDTSVHVPNTIARRNDGVCFCRKEVAQFNAVGREACVTRNFSGHRIVRSNENLRSLRDAIDRAAGNYPRQESTLIDYHSRHIGFGRIRSGVLRYPPPSSSASFGSTRIRLFERQTDVVSIARKLRHRYP